MGSSLEERNWDFIKKYFASIVDTCEKLAEERRLVTVEDYWESIPRLSDEDAKDEWKQFEADVQQTKFWNPIVGSNTARGIRRYPEKQ
jgi:hypothetical protein